PAAGLTAPAAVSAVHVGSHAVQVTWAPVPGALGYYVYRSAASPPANPASPVGWELAGDSATNVFTDSTALAGVPYFYAVQAYSFGNATGPLSPPVQVFAPY